MKPMFAGILGALLVVGLAGALSDQAFAGGRQGYHHDVSDRCNCHGPVVQVVDDGTKVVTTQRVVTTTQVVPRVRVIDHNRVVVHRRTIVHRQIVVRRRNIIERDITVHRFNTAHRFQTVHRNQVQYVDQNVRSRVRETRMVRGPDCNCAPGQRYYRGDRAWREYQQRHLVRSRY